MPDCLGCHVELPANAHFCNRCGLKQVVEFAIIADNQALKTQLSVSSSQPIRKIQLRYKSVSPHTVASLKPCPNKAELTVVDQSQLPIHIPFKLPQSLLPSQGETRGNLLSAYKANKNELRSSRKDTFLLPQQEIPSPIQTPIQSESSIATSRAALRWQRSWLERQHALGLSKIQVSRGQANVSSPIVMKNHNFVDKHLKHFHENDSATRTEPFTKHSNLWYWFAVVLLVSLIIGLLFFLLFNTSIT